MTETAPSIPEEIDNNNNNNIDVAKEHEKAALHMNLLLEGDSKNTLRNADAKEVVKFVDKQVEDLIKKAETVKIDTQKVAPDVKKMHALIDKQIADMRDKNPDWHERDAYNQDDPQCLATVAFIYYRLWQYKCEYKVVDPFPTGVPHAKGMRDRFKELQASKKGRGFPGFVEFLIKNVKDDIGKVHYTVLAAFTQLQPEQLLCKSMLAVDYNDPVQVSMQATFKLECERLCILFSDVCSGMFCPRKVQDPRFPDDPTKTVEELGVYQIPPYVVPVKTLDMFDEMKLAQYIRNYKIGVRYCVIALQIQSVFEKIKSQRLQFAKRAKDKEKSEEFPEMYRVPYRSFVVHFGPFIDNYKIKANGHTKDLLRWLEWEIIRVFDDILVNNCPGTDLLTYQRPYDDEFEVERLKKQGVKPTYMYDEQYYALMLKISQTSIHRRSPLLKKQLAKASARLTELWTPEYVSTYEKLMQNSRVIDAEKKQDV